MIWAGRELQRGWRSRRSDIDSVERLTKGEIVKRADTPAFSFLSKVAGFDQSWSYRIRAKECAILTRAVSRSNRPTSSHRNRYISLQNASA